MNLPKFCSNSGWVNVSYNSFLNVPVPHPQTPCIDIGEKNEVQKIRSQKPVFLRDPFRISNQPLGPKLFSGLYFSLYPFEKLPTILSQFPWGRGKGSTSDSAQTRQLTWEESSLPPQDSLLPLYGQSPLLLLLFSYPGASSHSIFLSLLSAQVTVTQTGHCFRDWLMQWSYPS